MTEMNKITIAGKERPVFYGLYAFSIIEEKTGYTLATLDGLFGNLKTSDLVAVVFAGLSHGARKNKVELDITEDEIYDLGIDELDGVMKQVEKALPKGEGKKGKK